MIHFYKRLLKTNSHFPNLNNSSRASFAGSLICFDRYLEHVFWALGGFCKSTKRMEGISQVKLSSLALIDGGNSKKHNSDVTTKVVTFRKLHHEID